MKGVDSGLIHLAPFLFLGAAPLFRESRFEASLVEDSFQVDGRFCIEGCLYEFGCIMRVCLLR